MVLTLDSWLDSQTLHYAFYDADRNATESETGICESVLGPRLRPQHTPSSRSSSQTRTDVKQWAPMPEQEGVVFVKKPNFANQPGAYKVERGRRPRHLENLFGMKYKTVPGILRRPLTPNHSIIQ